MAEPRTRGTQEASSFDIYDKEDSEQSFIEFVETQIAKIKKYTKLGQDGQLTFFDLNQALSEYQNINLTLIAMYNISKLDYHTENEDFETWYANRFLEIRERENPKTIAPGKWASTKEIEMMVRSSYSTEFTKRKHSLNMKEHQMRFLRRLTESWSSQQFILSTLSKNVQSEVAGLNVSR